MLAVALLIGLVSIAVIGWQLSKPEESEGAKELDRVVIGHTDGQFITLFTIFIGEKFGIFEKYGLKVVPESIESRIAVPALLSGSIDFSTITREVTTAALRGGDTRFVMMLINNQTQYLVGKKDIKLSEIESIAITNMHGTPHYLALKAMERGGFSADIKFMGSIPSVRAAVSRGDADAGVFGYFAPIDFEADGLVVIDDFTDDSLSIGLSTTDKKIRENSDKIKKVVTAFQEVVAYIQSHPEDIKPLLFEYYDYSEKVDTERRKVETAYNDLSRFLSSTGLPTEEDKIRLIQAAKAGEYENLEDIYSIEVTDEDMRKVFDLQFVE